MLGLLRSMWDEKLLVLVSVAMDCGSDEVLVENFALVVAIAGCCVSTVRVSGIMGGIDFVIFVVVTVVVVVGISIVVFVEVVVNVSDAVFLLLLSSSTSFFTV